MLSLKHWRITTSHRSSSDSDPPQDQSESGCYCSDEELRALLQKLPPPSTSKGCLVGTGESHGGWCWWDIQVPKVTWSSHTYECDYTMQERLLFATKTKRTSTLKWWSACQLLMPNLTRNLLSAKSCWTNLKPFPKMQWPVCPSRGRVPQPPTGSGRSDMIKSAFTALNRSGSGHLSAAEMKPFAEKTGALVMWNLCHTCTMYNPVSRVSYIVIGWNP